MLGLGSLGAREMRYGSDLDLVFLYGADGESDCGVDHREWFVRASQRFIATMEAMLKEICPPKRWADFLDRKDLDLAHEIPGVARFRGNYLYNHWGQAAVFRQSSP